MCSVFFIQPIMPYAYGLWLSYVGTSGSLLDRTRRDYGLGLVGLQLPLEIARSCETVEIGARVRRTTNDETIGDDTLRGGNDCDVHVSADHDYGATQLAPLCVE
jgi:hypothetical protein